MFPIYPHQQSWWGCKSTPVFRSCMEMLSNEGHSINPQGLCLWQVASRSENHWWSLLGVTHEPAPYLFCIPLAWSLSSQFVQEQALVSCIQHFVEVQPNSIHCSLHMGRKCCPVEGDQISQVWLAFVNFCRLSPVTCLVWFLILFERDCSIAFWEIEVNISGLAFLNCIFEVWKFKTSFVLMEAIN